MLTTHGGFSGFSVRDIEEARAFYGDKLGLTVEAAGMGNLRLTMPDGGMVLMYPKPDHVPAAFTILNFEVEDIGTAIAELGAAGIEPERYPGMPQDEDGAMRGRSVNRGPDIAWFTDPSGNIFSVLVNP